jgi:hypothetical protein
MFSINQCRIIDILSWIIMSVMNITSMVVFFMVHWYYHSLFT